MFEGWAGALRNFLRHRDLLFQMVGNDLRGRYVGSVLGLFWNVVHPLVLVAIYTLVFSRIMQARLGLAALPPHVDPGLGFSIYLCAGLLPWIVFAEVVNRSTNVFWENANLVKKVAFPKVLLHAYVATAGAANLAILVAAFLLFLGIAGALPNLVMLLTWIAFLLLQLVLALGLGFFTSTLNVFFRDVAQLTSVFVQLWFWLTPIVYVENVLPDFAKDLMVWNVMYHFASVHQGLMLYGQMPPTGRALLLLGVSFAVLLLGLGFFRSLRRRIPDEL